MMRIVACQICGSEKLAGKRCDNCQDLDATEDAIWRARMKFLWGAIDVDKLEELIHKALRDPPKPTWAGRHLVFR